jgi:hypothetical protein
MQNDRFSTRTGFDISGELARLHDDVIRKRIIIDTKWQTEERLFHALHQNAFCRFLSDRYSYLQPHDVCTCRGCERLVFSQKVDGTNQVFVMNADGTNVKQLTTVTGDNENPAWSPDESRIVFYADRLLAHLEHNQSTSWTPTVPACRVS